MLTGDKKKKIISKYKAHKTDTGSSDVQIALITEQIKELTDHLKANPKDNHSRRGLLKMVSKRKRLLDYLKREDEERYAALIKKLGLRK